MACPFTRIAALVGIELGSPEARAAYEQSDFHNPSASKRASSSKAPLLRSQPALSAGAGYRKRTRAAQEAADYVHSLRAEGEEARALAQQPLSVHLSQGTAMAHRRIERSEGVKAMMGSLVSAAADAEAGSKQKNKAQSSSAPSLALGRLDYIRWLVMLEGVYGAMEAPLLQLQSTATAREGTTLIQPFLEHPSLLTTLERLTTIRADLDAHLRELEDETLLDMGDLIEATMLECESASVAQKEKSNAQRAELALVLQQGGSSKGRGEYASLLTDAQVDATLRYTRRLSHLASLSTSSNAQAEPRAGASLLIAHAYTRYMGDLSGGQFIKKHVQLKWPCNASAASGFAFYDFDTAAFVPASDRATVAEGIKAVAGDAALKNAFRSALDTGLESTAQGSPALRMDLIEEMVEEANMAFDLNRGLFDALIGQASQPDDDETDAGAAELAQSTTAIVMPTQLSLLRAYFHSTVCKGQTPSWLPVLVLLIAVALCLRLAPALEPLNTNVLEEVLSAPSNLSGSSTF